MKSPATGKVLVRMTPQGDYGQRRQVPLLIFWKAVTPEFGAGFVSRVPGGHLFSVDEPTYGVRGRIPPTWPKSQGNFDQLWVFSVSSYLRSLGRKRTIDLEMRDAIYRWRAMGAMGKALRT